jgi:myosin heavy subunit
MDSLGCAEDALPCVVESLAAVLHLGNVADLQDGSSDPHFKQAAALLGLDAGKHRSR